MSAEITITKSGLDKIEFSPLDYWWHYRNPNRPDYEADEKTIFDDAFRCAVLRPDEFQRRYVNPPPINRKTNLGKSEYDSLIKSVDKNNQILLYPSSKYPDKFNTILMMVAEVRKHKLLKFIFSEGVAENHVEFEEENSGAIVKFKSHWIDHANNLIVHLSSTSDASPEQFAKDCVNFNNHKRSAIQLDGYATKGQPKDGIVFVNVEREAPYKISVLFLDERSINVGRRIYLENCQTFMDCVASGKWPGFKEIAESVSLPEWYLRDR